MKTNVKKSYVFGSLSQWTSIFGIIILFVTLQSSGCRKDEDSNPIYGTPGPAGGIVFYDKGYYSDGWRYLEVSPFDQPGQYIWGCSYVYIPAYDQGLGKGLSNTDLILSRQDPALGSAPGCDLFVKITAARTCSEFELNGYSDWFLPSGEEMGLVFENLYARGYGSLSPHMPYWTSSVKDEDQAYYIDATNYRNTGWDAWSTQDNNYQGKSREWRVRPVRRY